VVQTRLEEYLTLADVLPLDMVENTEKSREKDRRQVTREEKILQQKEEHVSRRPDNFIACISKDWRRQCTNFTLHELVPFSIL